MFDRFFYFLDQICISFLLNFSSLLHFSSLKHEISLLVTVGYMYNTTQKGRLKIVRLRRQYRIVSFRAFSVAKYVLVY